MSSAHSIIGVTVAIIGNILISIALNIQKFAHNSIEQRDSLPTGPADQQEKEESYIESPLWWLGMGIMLLGELGNFSAYGELLSLQSAGLELL